MIPVLQRNIVLPIIELARREPISRCLGELTASERLSRDQLCEMQWGKLKRLVDHAYRNVPFYRDRFDRLQARPEEIRRFEDYARLPTLTKDEIRDNQTAMREAETRRRIEHCRSGGTLGEPLTLVRDSLASAYARAAQQRGLAWHGLQPGEKQIRLWGIPVTGAAAWKERFKDRALNRIRISSFDVSPENVRSWVETFRRYGARYIYGYTSAVHRVCQLIEELGLDGGSLPVEFAVCTAETLHPHQRETIERSLDCRVINEYGCSEMGPISMECPQGSMHLSMENILVEFVKREAGAAPPEIVLTNLNSFSMPMMRYKIQDTGRLLDGACECGRGLAMMDVDAGRVMVMLRSTDGRYVSGTYFAYIAFDVINEHGGIRDFRVVQKEADRLEVTLVKTGDFTDLVLERFTARVREKLGEAMRIDYLFVDEIPPEPSGKRLYVVSEIEERT